MYQIGKEGLLYVKLVIVTDQPKSSKDGFIICCIMGYVMEKKHVCVYVE